MKPQVLGVLALLAGAACGPTPPPTATSTPPATTTPATTTEVAPAIAIPEAFDLYVAAVNAKNTDTAMTLTASQAIARFEEFRKHALTSNEAQLAAALPPGPRATVYVLRGRVEPAVLRSGDGRSLMAFAIQHGLIAVNTSSKYVRADGTTVVNQAKPQLAKLSVTGDRATADLDSDDPNAPKLSRSIQFAFVRENGQWMADPSTMIDSATTGLEELAAKKGVTPDQVITEALTAQFGAARAAQLRKPIDG